MELIFFGLLLIFFKINMDFVEIGITYYLTNIFGYLIIFLGLNKLEGRFEKLNRLKPIVIMMIMHSLLFFLLNLTNNSPLGRSLSGNFSLIIVILATAMILLGMFVVYYIIHTLIETIKKEHISIDGIKRLNQLNNAMTIVYIFTGFSFFINYLPLLTGILISSLLILQVAFLIYFLQYSS